MACIMAKNPLCMLKAREMLAFLKCSDARNVNDVKDLGGNDSNMGQGTGSCESILPNNINHVSTSLTYPASEKHQRNHTPAHTQEQTILEENPLRAFASALEVSQADLPAGVGRRVSLAFEGCHNLRDAAIHCTLRSSPKPKRESAHHHKFI
eukprot:6464334-Amphidinium_carterae.1